MANISQLESLIVETAVRKARTEAEERLDQIEGDLLQLIDSGYDNPLGQFDGATKVQWESIKATIIAAHGNRAKATAVRDFVEKVTRGEPSDGGAVGKLLAKANPFEVLEKFAQTPPKADPYDFLKRGQMPPQNPEMQRATTRPLDYGRYTI